MNQWIEAASLVGMCRWIAAASLVGCWEVDSTQVASLVGCWEEDSSWIQVASLARW